MSATAPKYIHPWFDAPGVTDDHRAKLELLAGVFSEPTAQVVLGYQHEHGCQLPEAIDGVYDMVEQKG